MLFSADCLWEDSGNIVVYMMGLVGTERSCSFWIPGSSFTHTGEMKIEQLCRGWGRIASYTNMCWKKKLTWIPVLRSAWKWFQQVSIHFVLPVNSISFSVQFLRFWFIHEPLVIWLNQESRFWSMICSILHALRHYSYFRRDSLPSLVGVGVGRAHLKFFSSTTWFRQIPPWLTWECEWDFRKVTHGLWQVDSILDVECTIWSRHPLHFPKEGVLNSPNSFVHSANICWAFTSIHYARHCTGKMLFKTCLSLLETPMYTEERNQPMKQFLSRLPQDRGFPGGSDGKEFVMQET